MQPMQHESEAGAAGGAGAGPHDADAVRTAGAAEHPGGSAESSPSSRSRRSDATRAAILRAARERFASDGYERATIRAVARDAAIDPSMVMRYFGNKEGLFAAASEIDLRLPDLSGVPADEIGTRLVRHFLERWEGDDTLNAMLRVGVTNPAGAQRLHTVFREQVAPVVESVCPDPRQAPVRAALLASQVLGLALTRYVLKLPPAEGLTHEEIVDWLGPTVQRYLTAEEPQGEEPWAEGS